MLAIKHILFPIDFSEQCCSAAPFVNAIATRFGAKVTLISALQPVIYGAMSDPYAGVACVNIDEMLEDLKTRLSGRCWRSYRICRSTGWWSWGNRHN